MKLTVNRLNDKYRASCDGGDIIYFEEKPDREIKLAQRLAFFGASDILLITAPRSDNNASSMGLYWAHSCLFRDGLNRYPMEFTLARKRAGEITPEIFVTLPGAGTVGQGLVIVSEFISSARVMRGALTVNPWNTHDVLQTYSTFHGMITIHSLSPMIGEKCSCLCS